MENYQPKRLSQNRRPWEFKKKLAAWAVVIATLSAVASYALAFRDQQTASDVTTTIFSAWHRLPGQLCSGLHRRKDQPQPAQPRRRWSAIPTREHSGPDRVSGRGGLP